MMKFRIGLIIVSTMIIIAELAFFDFSNLISSKNLGPCLTSTGVILVIISQVIEIRRNKRELGKFNGQQNIE